MKNLLLALACTAVFGLAVSGQTVRKVDFAKKIAKATPPELPQTPVPDRKGTEAGDAGLHGKIKSVVEFNVDARDPKPVRKLYNESYYSEAGILTKSVDYSDGYPFEVTVYGYIDGMRVSRSGEITYAKGEKPPRRGLIASIDMTPESNSNLPRDDRYQMRHEYQYDPQGRLIEVRHYENNGALSGRTTYTYEGENPTLSRLELDFGFDGNEWSRTKEVLFPNGDIKERVMYGAENEPPTREIHQYTYDTTGNWITDKTSQAKTVKGKEVVKPLWTSYRTITYYTDGAREVMPEQIKPKDPPKALDDYFSELWKTYEFKEDKFKIRLPGKPTETPHSPNSGGIIKDNVITLSGVINYTIVSVKYSVDFEKLGKADAILEGGKKNSLDVMKDLEPRITKEEDFNIGRHPGKFVRIETNQGRVIRIKTLIVNSHLYSLTASSGKTAPNVMGSENDYEKITMTFLDSFELIM